MSDNLRSRLGAQTSRVNSPMRRGRKLPAAEVVPAVEAHVTIVLAQGQMTRSDPNRAKTVHAQLISAIQTHAETIRAPFVAHTIDAAEELTAMLTSQIGHPVS